MGGILSKLGRLERRFTLAILHLVHRQGWLRGSAEIRREAERSRCTFFWTDPAKSLFPWTCADQACSILAKILRHKELQAKSSLLPMGLVEFQGRPIGKTEVKVEGLEGLGPQSAEKARPSHQDFETGDVSR
jgi:hypothetical protein